jgi:hypothetical protein
MGQSTGRQVGNTKKSLSYAQSWLENALEMEAQTKKWLFNIDFVHYLSMPVCYRFALIISTP